VKLSRTLRQYREGVLAAIRLRLSNGRMEGLNNKIGVIKAPRLRLPLVRRPGRDGLPQLKLLI
jgi:hypothetical protein